MGWFLLYLFVALQVAACVIAVVARSWKLTPAPIVWRGTDIDVAAHNVQQFLIDIDDSRFAYPTGMFVPDPSSEPSAGRVVMREDNFKGSHGVGWAFRVFAAFHEGWRRQMARDAHVIVYLAWPIWMALAALLAAPLLLAAILDIGYRQAFRSRIEAVVTKHPGITDAVDIQLEFQGLSAFGLVSDALRGMTAPVLPAGLVAAATPDAASGDQTHTLAAVGGRAAAWAQGAEQRFRVIYGSAIGAAVAVALVLALAIQHGTNSDYDSSYANPSYDNGSSSQDSQSNSGPTTQDSQSTDSSGDTSSSTTSSPGSSSGNATGASVFNAIDGYSVEPPSGWIRNSDSKTKSGFTESRWHLAGNPDTYVLVDHTAGYSGTAHAAASAVRALVKRTHDYKEYAWTPVDDHTWQWEFSFSGERKIDRFVTACGDGFAILGAVPKADFETNRATIEAFTASLIPPCDQSGP